MVRGLWSVLLLLTAPACTSTDVFSCQSSEQCVAGPYSGQCQATGHCSFPDDDCPSGQRYGEHAGDLAGECVTPGDVIGTGSGEGTVSGEGTGPSTSPGSTGGSTASPPDGDGTTVAATTTPATETSVSETDPSATTGSPPGYGPCGAECPDTCLMHSTGPYAVCTINCETDDDCAAVESDDGVSYPTACGSELVQMPLWCVVPCRTDADCPAGMECAPFLGLAITEACMWPF